MKQHNQPDGEYTIPVDPNGVEFTVYPPLLSNNPDIAKECRSHLQAAITKRFKALTYQVPDQPTDRKVDLQPICNGKSWLGKCGLCIVQVDITEDTR